MITLVHLSDTHFGTEIPAVVEAVRKAVQRIRPDVVVLSGDITQRARRRQFAAAATFMGSLHGGATLIVPGNHDIPLFNVFGRLFTPYANYRRAFGPRERVLCYGNVGIVGYDATRVFRHTRGRVADAALRRGIAEARQALTPEAILIACAHQPLLTAWPQDADEVLIHHDRTARLFAEQRVDVVLSGHVHVPLLTTTADAFPALDRHFILAGAGTAVSARTRPGAPNSFNVLRIDTAIPTIEIIRFEFDAARQRCVPMASALFRRAATGWTRSEAVA